MPPKILLVLIILIASCRTKHKQVPWSTSQEISDSFNKVTDSFLKNKEYDSAKNDIDSALHYDPKNYASYNNRAVWKSKKQMPTKEVLADFDTSLYIKPDYWVALFSLANYYDEINDHVNEIKACDNFINKADKTECDSSYSEEINGLKNKAEKYETIINGISVSRAIAYYDSINSVLLKTLPVQNRFATLFKNTVSDILHYRNKKFNKQYLKNYLDSAERMNDIQFKEVSSITEVDSTLSYRDVILNHCIIINNLYKTAYSDLFYCESMNDALLLRNCYAAFKHKLTEGEEIEKEIKIIRNDFKTKYRFTD